MDKERPVVALDFLGLEGSPCETLGEERNGDRNMLQKPTAFFPTVENRSSPSVAMSLRTRENSAMALKRIFDQINASSEKCALQHLDTEGMGKTGLPFHEGTREDGKCRDGLPQPAVRAPESSFTKPLDDLREADLGQRTRDMRRAWIQSQDGGNLLSLRSVGDGEARRTEGNARSSPQCAADIKPSLAFSPLQQQEPVFDITERKAATPPPLPQPQRRGGNLSPLYKTATGLGGPDHQVHQLAAHQQAFDHSRKRVTDVNLPFRKAIVQDPGAFLSQQTAFGSPISVPAFSTTHPYTSPNAAQWPEQGFYHPVQGIDSQSSKALRPNVPARQLTAQLTIFYSGMVNVYDDVPADKAHAIMLLAGSGNSSSRHLTTDAQPTLENVPSLPPLGIKPATTAIPLTGTSIGLTPTATAVTPSIASPPPTISQPVHTPSASVNSAEMKQSTSTTPEISKQPQSAASAAKRLNAELPHARKASLARFLEKRRDRVQSKPPLNETKASEDTDLMFSETPPSPKRRYISRSPSPSSTRPRCSSSFSTQSVAEDQTIGNNCPTTNPQRVV